MPTANFTEKEVISKLSKLYIPSEIDEMIPLIREINQLKKEKNAVLLGHNYMTPDVFYGVSDIIGDSLYLSKAAAEVDADIILFNGVHFMAETAKILSPHRKVLIADEKAGCSLAESITRDEVKKIKAQYPGVPVVTYVNCSAAVKAETDICCTSANAAQIIEAIDSDTVIFLPDEYLADNMRKLTKKKIISHPGRCMVHEMYTPLDIQITRQRLGGDVTVISHPECSKEVVDYSDFSGSTSQMIDFVKQAPSKNILLITECSMGDNLRMEFPDKYFVSTCQTCPHMKKITLEKIKNSLINETFEILIDEDIIEKARNAVNRMLEISFKK
ncbi:quinolinate synthase NadA [Leptospira sp. GIMC2001]|uniref:quinolinate synthase NadA n=1 Tax=Leptospira sp. GIMC2001 TaxID=1513297 RepID=UPI00234B31F5|nr:quinolinate synthase NadA [Leptospira sp. GIMC2001]WCL48553.1 quinolinate synthase NadA [Leptospira sp. GIMC2001]